MRKVLKNLAIILAVIIMIIMLPISGLFVHAANSTEIYQVNGYDDADIIFDSEGNVIHGYAYCLNRSRDACYFDCDFVRFRLSDTNYGTIFNGPAGTPEEEYEAKRLLLNALLKKDSVTSATNLSMQRICWIITDGYLNENNYPNGLQTSYRQLKDLLIAEPYYDFDQYDAYYYQTQDTNYQNMLGSVFIPVDTSFTIEKTVIDGLDATEIYNGVDGVSGFEVNINVYDTLGDRPVINETFVFTGTDADGNVTSQSITTDTSGNLTLNILSGQSITISGFDSVNYRFTLSEATTNTDSTCSLDSISSSNGNLVNNNDGSYSFDFSTSYVVDIDIFNRHISADPTPVPTEPSATTTAETTEETTATTADVDAVAATTTSEETTTTVEETTSESAEVLGAARASEETTAAPTATPTPVPAVNGVANTGEDSHAPRIIAGIVLVIGAAVVMTVRLTRKSPEHK
jgi:hypothetical protein